MPSNWCVYAAIRQGDFLGLPHGQFIGSWQVHSTNFNSDGTRTERQGEWHFAWILGGRGVQDVLFAHGAPRHKYGTTLRCYDPAHDVWRVCWMAPGGGEFANLLGRQIGESIVQEGTGPDPRRLERWTFSDITATAFTWRGLAGSRPDLVTGAGNAGSAPRRELSG